MTNKNNRIMDKTNDFAAQVAASDKKAQHEQEIKQTRVGGLGGSDAALVLKVGKDGLRALSVTDHKRLAVMMGLKEQEDWGGNSYTNAGHEFEDYAEKMLPFGTANVEREAVLTAQLARNFKVFAHADFLADGAVVECKFVQSTTQSCSTKYAAQLQWYYMLGAQSVCLYHGQGSAEPFEVFEANLVQIEKDEMSQKFLLNGLQIIDEAIANGWKPEVAEKCDISTTPDIVQRAFQMMAEVKEQEKELAARKAEAQTVLMDYMRDFEFSSMQDAVTKHSVTYTKAGITKTFDTKKLAAEHPELDLGRYYKQSQRSASITFK